MGDTSVAVLEPASGATSLIDSESVTTTAGNTKRQRVRIGGAGATDLAKVFANGSLQVGYDNELQAAQNITASSGVGANSALGLADATYTAGSTITFQTAEDHSNVDIQISGSWTGTIYTERTIDGLVWFPTNARRNAAGNQIVNALTQNGLYVGTFATSYKYRLRAGTDFVGTATIAFAAGLAGGVFLLSEVTVVSEAQYFASSAGKNTAWGVHSQDVALTSAGTEYPLLFLWNNDATGGRVLYLSKVTKGASNSCRIRRYRTGPGGTNMTRTSGGTALTINNRANQNAAATAAQAWGGTGIVVANQPAYYEKSVYIGSQGGQLETDEAGGILVPPQTGLLFTAVAGSANMTAGIEAAFWDGLTLP